MHKLGPHDFGENDSGILWNPCAGTFGSRTFDWQLAKHTQDEIWRGTLQAKVRVALVHRLQFGPALQQRGTRSKAPKIRIAIIALQQRETRIGLLPSGIAAYT